MDEYGAIIPVDVWQNYHSHCVEVNQIFCLFAQTPSLVSGFELIVSQLMMLLDFSRIARYAALMPSESTFDANGSLRWARSPIPERQRARLMHFIINVIWPIQPEITLLHSRLTDFRDLSWPDGNSIIR